MASSLHLYLSPSLTRPSLCSEEETDGESEDMSWGNVSKWLLSCSDVTGQVRGLPEWEPPLKQFLSVILTEGYDLSANYMM